MRTTLAIIAMSVLAALGVQHPAAAQEAFVLARESTLWIEGTSTVDAFVCKAGRISGFGWLQGDDPNKQAEASLTVPVASFDCGKRRMNEDMYAAMKASAFPEIQFRMERAEVQRGARGSKTSHSILVNGWLRLAGVERAITAEVQGTSLPDGRLRGEGAVTLRMSDFGITPPTALLGLVRAHDWITVRFDLYGAREGVAHAIR